MTHNITIKINKNLFYEFLFILLLIPVRRASGAIVGKTYPCKGVARPVGVISTSCGLGAWRGRRMGANNVAAPLAGTLPVYQHPAAEQSGNA
jgi:hypothetical protein